jgi:hypothetical protein
VEIKNIYWFLEGIGEGKFMYPNWVKNTEGLNLAKNTEGGVNHPFSEKIKDYQVKGKKRGRWFL